MKRLLLPLILLAAAPLAGCAGFEPLYAMPNVAPVMRSVDIVTDPGRVGYLMREQLNDELARDLNQPARYRLNLTIAEVRIPRGLRINNIAAEIELELRVNYDLVENATGRSVLRGQTATTVFYAATAAPYAGIAAQQDAQERAAGQVAVQIRLDLSRKLATASRAPAPQAAP